MSDIEITDERDKGLVLAREGAADADAEIVGYIQYFVLTEPERALVPVHTIVEREHEGKGIAGAMVRELYGVAAREGIAVAPLCSYVVKWAERHPEEAPAVSDELLDAARRTLAADPGKW